MKGDAKIRHARIERLLTDERRVDVVYVTGRMVIFEGLVMEQDYPEAK